MFLINPYVWYGIALAGSFALVCVFPWVSKALVNICNISLYIIHKFLVYPYIIQRRYLTGVNALELLLLVAYVAGNGVSLKYGVHNISELMTRSGLVAAVNIVPLFFGGRTSFIVDRLGIPLNTYYILHHWIGRITIVEGALHAILTFFSPIQQRNSHLPDILLAICLAGLMVLSVYPIRNNLYEFFLKSHFLLAMIAILAIIWHLDPITFPRVILPVAALCLWSTNTVLRFWLFCRTNSLNNAFFAHSNKSLNNAYLTKFYNTPPTGAPLDLEVITMRLTIETKEPISITAGQYCYLIFRDLRWVETLKSHPFMICCWEEDTPDEIDDTESRKQGILVNNDESNKIHLSKDIKAKKLIFFIQRKTGLTADLANGRTSLGRVYLDGPYGQNPRLHAYDTVVLVAKGMGIASLLPYAKYLLDWKARESRRRDVITRKLDLYWELDNNLQDRWMGMHLNELCQKNNKLSTPLLQLWCYFPEAKSSEPIFKTDESIGDYRAIFPGIQIKTLEEAVTESLYRSIGRSVIVTCGLPIFTRKIRDIACSETSWEHHIEFIETEYRPWSFNDGPSQDDGAYNEDKEPLSISSPILHTLSPVGNIDIKSQKL